MTRWLITGGCGFIGRNLVRHLLAEGGHQVRVLDNLTVGRRERLAELGTLHELPARAGERGVARPGIELVVGDVLDPDTVHRSARGRHVVVHLAANTGVAPSIADPHGDAMANVIGTLNCLDAARAAGARRFVFASSGAVLGAAEPPLREDKAPRPASPYGASKLAGEGYCSAYWSSFGVETVVLRFGNVYGPGSDHKSSVIAAFVKQALAGETLEIYGDGGQTRDFIFVEDLIQAITTAAQRPGIGGEIFQIATARETTIGEIAERLLAILAEAGVRDVTLRHADPRRGDARRNYADTSKARQMLGWRAATPLEAGLRHVVRWFLSTDSDLGRRTAAAGLLPQELADAPSP